VLSEDVRSELAAIDPRRRCDRLSELSALFHTAGSLHLRGRGDVSLHLDLVSSGVARRAFSLLRALALESEIRTYRRHAFGRETRFQLHVAGAPNALAVLREAGVLSSMGTPLQRPPRRVVGKRCCRAAYLRGALLGAGSVSGPRFPHLEVRCATAAAAEFLSWAVGLEDVRLAVRERSRFAVAYAKGAARIADALALAGAFDAALAIEEHAVIGSARAQANRLANADHANLNRSSRAAHEQLENIRELERSGQLDRLPERLKEIAELRLRHPSLSLSELARKCRPPASKASVHRRLARLAVLAGR
jgi:DNA-binding protein WhiA